MFFHKAVALAAVVLLSGRVLGAPHPASPTPAPVSETDACKDKSLDEKCKWDDKTQDYKQIEGTCQIRHSYERKDGDKKKPVHSETKVCSDKELPGPVKEGEDRGASPLGNSDHDKA